jgi:alpha,alpha-trehalose phosphorylase
MAQRNLRAAADAVERHPLRSARLGIDPDHVASWRRAADAMTLPYDHDLGVHAQSEGFTRHEAWDFEATGADQYPLMLHFPYFDLYRKQVVKQADLVLALHWRGDAFLPDEKQRDFDFYERLTVRDSSLSACTQSVVATEVGHLELAYDYFCDSALIDLEDLEHNTRDGLHIAALAGSWIAAVAGFGGLRDHDGAISFAPHLPKALTRLAFRLCLPGRRLLVEVRPRLANYSLTGPALDIAHHGQPVTLTEDAAVSLPIPPPRRLKAPEQPHGRKPGRRQRPAPSRRPPAAGKAGLAPPSAR